MYIHQRSLIHYRKKKKTGIDTSYLFLYKAVVLQPSGYFTLYLFFSIARRTKIEKYIYFLFHMIIYFYSEIRCLTC